MAYVDMYTASRDASFLQRLEIAITIYARDVIKNDTKDTPNRMNRAILATTVLQDTANWAQKFKDAVAANGVTNAGANSADSDFYSAVVFYWDAFAGIVHNSSVTI